jgi:2-methylcitrate dehydratase PrpD
MIQKVDFGVHPEAEAAGYDKMTTILEIVLKDGRTITGRADFGKGSPANPMSYDEVADKFRECAAYSRWPKTKAEQVVEMVRHLEEVRQVRELTTLLSRDAGGAASKGKVGARATRPAKASPRKPARTVTTAKAKKRAR